MHPRWRLGVSVRPVRDLAGQQDNATSARRYLPSIETLLRPVYGEGAKDTVAARYFQPTGLLRVAPRRPRTNCFPTFAMLTKPPAHYGAALKALIREWLPSARRPKTPLTSAHAPQPRRQPQEALA